MNDLLRGGVDSLFRLWRIGATGFSFALFGLGALIIALALGMLLYPCPISAARKRHITRSTIWGATWLYVRIMRGLGLLTFGFESPERLGEPGVLIVANHPSLLDVVFLMSATPSTNCIVKAAMFRNLFTAPIVRMAGYIRNDNDGEVLVSRAAEALAAGDRLIIFPEGTRTDVGESVRFKRGAANIALRAMCTIQPVAVRCTPPTLRKREPWYQVPPTRPHFHFSCLNPVNLQSIDLPEFDPRADAHSPNRPGRAAACKVNDRVSTLICNALARESSDISRLPPRADTSAARL